MPARIATRISSKPSPTLRMPSSHHGAAGAFSCMSCHRGKRAFGGDDFSVCTRCHTEDHLALLIIEMWVMGQKEDRHEILYGICALSLISLAGVRQVQP